jgi:hypothetical protein
MRTHRLPQTVRPTRSRDGGPDDPATTPATPAPTDPAATTTPTTPTPTTTPVDPAASAFTPAGPFAAEAKDTFDALTPDVSASKLRPEEAVLLATGTEQLGVIGEAEAIRAARAAEALSPDDRTAFQALLDKAPTNLGKTYLYKALGAGYGVADVTRFAQAIGGMTDAQLLDQLTLGDEAGADTGVQDGVKQQYEASCVPTTAQALRAEFDPVYALKVHGGANKDIHAVDDANPTAINPDLAAEQKALLEGPGTGQATPRNQSGRGSTDLDAVYNTMSPFTGYSYHVARFTHLHDLAQTDTTLDAMASQLGKGIATPFRVTGDWGGGHAVLAMAVEGTGADQRFLVHDPWDGKTLWVKRTEFEKDTFDIAGWHSIGGYGAATPYQAPPPVPVVLPTPAPTPTP